MLRFVNCTISFLFQGHKYELFCLPRSGYRRVPFAHLEHAVSECFDPACMQLSPSSNLDDAVDEIIQKDMSEYSWSLCFDNEFVMRLFHAGFLPICTTIGAKSDPIFVLLPKLHNVRCIVVSPIGENVVFSKSTKKLAKKYFITINTSFEAVMDACCEQHGSNCWLFPPVQNCLTDLNRLRRSSDPVQVHSIELRDRSTSALMAGEIGYSVGDVYTSMTGFYTVSGSGSVQLFLLALLLQSKKYQVWDLGMTMEYKVDIGGISVSRADFVRLFREHRSGGSDPL